jgi:hypothetical protein
MLEQSQLLKEYSSINLLKLTGMLEQPPLLKDQCSISP